jgi:hypothetical protein
VSSHRNHIPFALLVDMIEGRLIPDDQMRAHLAECAACASSAAWLERTIGLMRADRSVDAPATLISEAKRLFRVPPPAARPSLRQRIAAVLSFDSATMPLVFGMRSGISDERQLFFNAGDLDIDVRISRHAGAPADEQAAWLVTGQILGADGGQQIELRGPTGSAVAPINALGEFAFAPVPAGRYEITLELANRDLDIPAFEISA